MADANTRPSRADEVRQERRRKPGSTIISGLNLAVDESRLDRNTYEYRWVNDRGARMASMHGQDWDPAPEVGDGSSVTGKIVGTDESGKPFSGILMRKRKDWYVADQKEKQAPLEEMDRAIRAGTSHVKAAPELRDNGYTPNGSNTIEISGSR